MQPEWNDELIQKEPDITIDVESHMPEGWDLKLNFTSAGHFHHDFPVIELKIQWEQAGLWRWDFDDSKRTISLRTVGDWEVRSSLEALIQLVDLIKEQLPDRVQFFAGNKCTVRTSAAFNGELHKNEDEENG